MPVVRVNRVFVGLLAALTLALLWVVPAQAAVSISNLSEDRYFSPNGDGTEDTGHVSYLLSDAADVDVTIKNSAGVRVRFLENSVSHSAGGQAFDWDGLNDSGVAVADGIYTYNLRAEDAGGSVGTAVGRMGVDRRVPAPFIRPAPNNNISGQAVSAAVKAPSGVNVSSVQFRGRHCADTYYWWDWQYCYFDSTSIPGVDGSFGVTIDSTLLVPGANELGADVQWNDAFGAAHYYFATVPVVVANPVAVAELGADRYFSPNGDGQEDTIDLSYRLSGDATVDIDVRNTANTLVKRFTGVSATVGWNSTNWDGKQTNGTLATNGAYTYVVHAVNAYGAGSATGRVGIDRGALGTVTKPVANATLSGTQTLTFTPRSGLPVTAVDFYGTCAWGYGCGLGGATRQSNGTWSLTADTKQLSDGDNGIDTNISYTDAFNADHGWTAPRVPITVNNPVRINSHSDDRYFSPDGDNQEDTGVISYELTRAATVSVAIKNAGGTLVRTLTTDHTCYCGGSVEWDGRNTAGALVPSGSYSYVLTATDPKGGKATYSGHIGVDTRKPVSLTRPTSGQNLTGTTTFTARKTTGFDAGGFSLSYVDFYTQCSDGGCWYSLGHSDTPDAGGDYAVPVDTTQLRAGPHTATAYATWTDPYGATHQTAASNDYRVGNDVAITFNTAEHAFTPNGDGSEDEAQVNYSVSGSATVDVDVLDNGGSLVRHLVEARAVSSSDWVYWDGTDGDGSPVPQGQYRLRFTATDDSGGTDVADWHTEVVRGSVGAVRNPGANDTLSDPQTYVFDPGSGYIVTAVRFCPVYYQCVSSPAADGDGMWRATDTTAGLPDGPRTLSTYVDWVDSFGQSHDQELRTDIAIDNSAPSASFISDPSIGPAPLATQLVFDVADSRNGPLTYSLDFGDGSPMVNGTVSPPYPTVRRSHNYPDVGTYRAHLTVTDSAGHTTNKSTTVTVESGSANHAPTATLSVSPEVGVAPLDVHATIAGSDADGDGLTYRVDWGDGTTDDGDLPHGPLTHHYDTARDRLVRLSVSDGHDAASDAKSVRVALAEPLKADAGDDLTAETGQEIDLDGSNSRPAAGIESYNWDFGDGGSSHEAIGHHAYTQAGTYTAKLTVRSGSTTRTDSATVRVHTAQPAKGLTVTVGDGQPVPDADVLVITGDGTRHSAVTGLDGKARLAGLDDGDYTVYGYAPGHKPATAAATQTDGVGSVDLTLEAGELATTQLDSRRLTQDEVVAAGIDPADPDNQHIYQFEIHLAFVNELGQSSDEIDFGGYAGSGGFIRARGNGGPECSGDCGSFTVGGLRYEPQLRWVDDQPVIQWLIIPGKAKFLKEFFEVSMIVQNLSGPEFTFENGSATLEIPDGLSLAPTELPQDATRPVEDIHGGTSERTSWIVRGDAEGDYPLSATYTGSLEPLGRTVSFRAETATPLKVWAGSALKMIVDADDHATNGVPYHVRIGLQNVSDIPVYNPTVELLKGDGHLLNYIYQPREELEHSDDVVQPGATFWTRDYILVPRITGTLDVSQSFVMKTAGDVDLPSEIQSHSSARPVLGFTGTSGDHSVHLDWAPVPGASEYEVFSTPGTDIQFPDEPVATRRVNASDPTDVIVDGVDPEAPAEHYAVSALVGGHPVMQHALVAVGALPGASGPSTSLTATPACGASITVNMTFTDNRSTLTAYRTRLGATAAWTEAAITKSPHTITVAKKITVPSAGTTLYVQAKNANGDWGQVAAKVMQQCVSPSLGVDNVRLREGNGGTKDMKFTVSLNAPHSSAVTFKATTATATATADDFTALPLTTYTIPAGQTTQTITIPIAGDSLVEGDETFQLKLSGQTSGIALRDSVGTGTIVDDETPMALSVDDVASPEGNSGSHNQRFEVRLSRTPPAGQPVTVSYATANGSATAGSDYTAESGTLTFDSTTGPVATVDVPVSGDTTTEAAETFSLNASGTPKGVFFADKQGIATVLNDDGTASVQKPRLYVDDLWVPEGDSGTSTATFHLRLDKALTQSATIKVATGDSTATAGSDYDALPLTTVTIPAGATTANVPVTVHGDVDHEAAEVLLLKLSSPSSNIVVGDSSGQATLGDEEGPMNVYVTDARAPEGTAADPGSLTYTVTMGDALTPNDTITVTYATANGTALAGSDYTATTGTLTFTQGTGRSQDVTVSGLGDDVFESNETVTLSLKTALPKGTVLADTSGSGTIINDD